MGNRVSQLIGIAPKVQQKRPVQPVAVNKEEELIAKKVETQKLTNHINENIDIFCNKQAKYEAKINNLKLKAKEHLQNGKTKEAKKVLQQVARINKQLQRITVRRKLIQNQNEQIETHMLNKQVIEAIEVAHELTKEDLNGKLEEHIITAKQNKILQDQINENMKQLVQNSEDEAEADELMKQLEMEIDKNNKKKIPAKNVIANSKNIATNKQRSQQSSDFDKMLAQL